MWAERDEHRAEAGSDRDRLLRALPTLEELPAGFTRKEEVVAPGDEASASGEQMA